MMSRILSKLVSETFQFCFVRNEFGDLYLVTNRMEIDLYKIIRSKQDLTDDHR